MAIATTPPENTISPETGNQDRSQDEAKTTRPKRTISNLSASPIGEGLSVDSFKFDNLKNTIQQMVAQPAVKKTLPALIVFFILLIFVSIFAQGEFFKPTTYRLLLPGLNEPEKQMALETLNEGGYDSKVDKKTGHLMVVEKSYHEARMFLASKGIPQAPIPTGIETLKDQSSMTTSQFMEQVNYVSALEQDLGRSISAMATVNSARVHLALPKQSVFVRDRTPPKASVVVSPIPNRIVTATQVDAIVHLIASSVPYLDPTHVSIVDNFGNLLTRKNDSAAGLSSTQMSHKQDIEQTYRSRILEILTPVFGEGNVQAQVDVSMNFRQTEITSEDFDRNGVGPKTRSETLAEDRTNKLDAQGVPGALTNAPPRPNELTDSTGALPDDFGQESVTLSKRATRNYEIDRIVKHVKEQVGLVERVSVAVVVNEKRTHPDFNQNNNGENQQSNSDINPNSKSLIAGYSQGEIDRLTNLVQGVVGYKEARGDVVTLMPTAFYEDPPEPWFKNPVTIDALKTAIASLVFLLFLLTIVRPIMTSMFAPPQTEEIHVDEEEEKDKEGIAMAHVAIEMAASEPAVEGLENAAIDMAVNEMAIEGPEVALSKIHESEGGLLTNEMIAAAQAAEQKQQAETAANEKGDKEGEEVEEEGFIDLDEGESLEEIKAKLKPKKASISMDMLDTANSYDDKVVLMRLLVQEDESRVAAVLRNMMKSA